MALPSLRRNACRFSNYDKPLLQRSDGSSDTTPCPRLVHQPCIDFSALYHLLYFPRGDLVLGNIFLDAEPLDIFCTLNVLTVQLLLRKWSSSGLDRTSPYYTLPGTRLLVRRKETSADVNRGSCFRRPTLLQTEDPSYWRRCVQLVLTSHPGHLDGLRFPPRLSRHTRTLLEGTNK